MNILIQFPGNSKPVEVPVTTIESLISKVHLMRIYQKDYFASRQDNSKRLAVNYEKAVDEVMKLIIYGEQKVLGF